MNSPSVRKRAQRRQFLSATKFHENVSGSNKLSKVVSKSSKPKWAFLRRKAKLYSLEEAMRASKERPLEKMTKAYGTAWKTKQAYKVYFSIKKETQWTRFKKLAVKESKETPLFRESGINSKQSLSFLILWESRLDVNLWRSNLAPTIETARQYVSHGLVFVNGKKSTQTSKLLFPGDIAQLVLPKRLSENKLEALKRTFLIEASGRQFPPFHLEVHYPSKAVVFAMRPHPKDLYYSFPLRLPKLL